MCFLVQGNDRGYRGYNRPTEFPGVLNYVFVIFMLGTD